MSPKTKASIANIATAVAAIVGVVGLVTGATRFAVNALDHRFVDRDAFVVYQSGLAQQHAVDSVNATRDMGDVKAMLARLDSNVTCLRHPQRTDCS